MCCLVFSMDSTPEEYDVTDSINPPSVQKSEAETPEEQSPWIMLITLLLLIGGLLLSSAMLLHYGLQSRGGTAGSNFSLAGLMERGRDFAAKARAQTPEEPAAGAPLEVAPESAGIKKFFPPSNGTLKWPKLKLTGFGKSVDSEGGFAIINGKQILIGNQIGDVTLVKIRTHGVVVELKGEQKTLTVDLPK